VKRIEGSEAENLMHGSGTNVLLHELIEEVARRKPNKTAMIYLGHRLSYQQFRDKFHRFASALVHLGVEKDDTVGIYLPNTPQSLIAFHGISKSGEVVLLLSAMYTAEELTFVLKENETKTVVCSDVNIGNILRIREEVGLKRIIVTRLDDELPFMKKLIGRGLDRIPLGHCPKDPMVHSYRRLMGVRPPDRPQPSAGRDEKILFILYTGGTTGTPKGVPHTHDETVLAFESLNKFYEPYLKEGDEVWCGYQPFYHMAGCMFFNNPLLRGETLIIFPSPNMDAILTEVKRRKITCIAGVPTFYNAVLNNERLDQYLPGLKSLKYLSTGADALPEDVFERWKKTVGSELLQTWGSSETFIASHNRNGEASLSLGSPLPGFEVAVLDVEENRILEPGEAGELAVKSPTTLKAYIKKPQETKESLVEIDGSIWYRTGDIGKKEVGGGKTFYYFLDRKKEIIKYKGYNIGASEVERVLYGHPAVKEVAVIGVPDKDVGEIVKAVVVLHENAKNVTFHDLLGLCRQKLSPYKIPKHIEFRDALPKSSHTGKILKRELREEEVLKREHRSESFRDSRR